MTLKGKKNEIWKLEWRTADGRCEPSRDWLRAYLKGSECELCGVRTFPPLGAGSAIPFEVAPKRPFSSIRRTPFEAVPDEVLEEIENRIAPHIRYSLVDAKKQVSCGWSAICFKEIDVVTGVMLDGEASELFCRRCKQIRYDRMPRIGLPFNFKPKYELWSVDGCQLYISHALSKEKFWNKYRDRMLLTAAEYAQPSRVSARVKQHKPRA